MILNPLLTDWPFNVDAELVEVAALAAMADRADDILALLR
jgi:hypothetical protein